jgi:hypothetical protein
MKENQSESNSPFSGEIDPEIADLIG